VFDRYRAAEPVDFHALNTRESGRQRFIYVHLLVPDNWTVQHGHDLSEQLKDDIADVLPGAKTFVHIEPRDDPKSYGHLDEYEPVPPGP
jgi:divalent metal cation (Fe/Co/Zn/Cd) transporter